MTDVERTIAELLLRAHQADFGPTGSEPKLRTTLTSRNIQELLEERGFSVEHGAVVSTLEQLAARDYVLLGRSADLGAERQIVKVYPARLKRDYNLWHIAEEL